MNTTPPQQVALPYRGIATPPPTTPNNLSTSATSNDDAQNVAPPVPPNSPSTTYVDPSEIHHMEILLDSLINLPTLNTTQDNLSKELLQEIVRCKWIERRHMRMVHRQIARIKRLKAEAQEQDQDQSEPEEVSGESNEQRKT